MKKSLPAASDFAATTAMGRASHSQNEWGGFNCVVDNNREKSPVTLKVREETDSHKFG
jgi:hypothetical protein